MANRDVLAIGTSAGGVKALLFLVERLPANFPAAILLTIHLSGHSRSALDEILTRAGALPAAFAGDGQRLAAGRIFIAPPGRHLLVDGNTLSLGAGPRENNARPAIDPMLRSVAVCCGYRSVGVVMTGTQDDGASGLWAINECGGTSVVQDPRDAAFPEMPLNALKQAKPAHIAPLADMPALLESLVRQPAARPIPPSRRLEFEVEVARNGRSSMKEMDRIGQRSVLACPDCHGVMWEINEGELIRYRCHVGHAYTSDMMGMALEENVRGALGSALRALEERVALAGKLQDQASDRNHVRLADNWAAKKEEFEAEAEVIRNAMLRADALAVKGGQVT